MRGTFYSRFGWLFIAAWVLSIPLLWQSSMRVLATNSNDVQQWLPSTLDEKRHLEEFLERFPNPESVIVSWDGCTLADPRLEKFAKALTQRAGEEATGERLIDHTVTGQQVTEQLMTSALGLPRERAVNHLLGTIIGPDRTTSCALTTLSTAGANAPAASIEAIYDAAKSCGIPEDDVHLAGHAIEKAAMDRETNNLLLRFSLASAVIALLVAWWCLKRFYLVAMLFATSLAITGAGLTVYDYCGGTMNSMLMPALLFVYAISGGVHVINYYQDAVNDDGPVGAAERGVRNGFWPCALSSLTTAIGLGSLMVSEIEPVRKFGAYSAIGLIIGFGVLFLLLPAMLQMWATWVGVKRSQIQEESLRASRFWDGAWMLQRRYHTAVTVVVCTIMAVLSYGFCYIVPSAKLKDNFWTTSRIYQDYEWIEANLGPLTTTEVVVTFKQGCTLEHEQRMELLKRLQDEISHIESQSTSTSAVTLAPKLADSKGLVSVARRLKQLKFLSRAGFYARDDESKADIWRVTVRIPATGDLRYSVFCEQVHSRIDRINADLSAAGTQGVTILQTGVLPLISRIQTELWNALLQSFVLSFALIALTMVLALRSIAAGLISMIPNMLPLCVSFGAMGWWGMSLDIGAIMTASIAMGIAVDDTFHFLCWYDRMRRQGRSASDSVRAVYHHCGAAMTQSSLISSCGLLVFFFSGFVPAAQFGILIFIMLMVALLGDLVLLPAILLGPAGRWFSPRIKVIPLEPAVELDMVESSARAKQVAKPVRA